MAQTLTTQSTSILSIASLTNVTLFTYSALANTIKGPSGNRMRLSMFGLLTNNSGANRVYTFVGSFGGTVFAEDAIVTMPASASARPISIDVDVSWVSAASQTFRMTLAIGPLAAATTGSGDWATANFLDPSSIVNNLAIATSSAQTLLVQVRSDNAGATQTYAGRGATLELV